MENKFRLQVMSDSDYEELVGLVYYENVELFVLSQDYGVDKIRICFFKPKNKFWQINLEKFIHVLEKAKDSFIINESSYETTFKQYPDSKKVNIFSEYIPEKQLVNVYVQHSLMCTIIRQDTSKEVELLIYPNLKEKQASISKQWEIPYKQFLQILQLERLRL